MKPLPTEQGNYWWYNPLRTNEPWLPVYVEVLPEAKICNVYQFADDQALRTYRFGELAEEGHEWGPMLTPDWQPMVSPQPGERTLPRGCLIRFHGLGTTYHGFIVGTCSWDNAGPDNAYVVRYVWRGFEEAPRRPYAVVAMDQAEPVSDWPDYFHVGGHWCATPADRGTERHRWQLVVRDGKCFIEPMT